MQLLAVGMTMAVAIAGGSTWIAVEVEATAFTDECGMAPWGITASGAKTQWGIIAAPPEIPFGTRIYIPGYGLSTVEDRGADIQGRAVDCWMPERGQALRWGRRTIYIWVAGVQNWPPPTEEQQERGMP